PTIHVDDFRYAARMVAEGRPTIHLYEHIDTRWYLPSTTPGTPVPTPTTTATASPSDVTSCCPISMAPSVGRWASTSASAPRARGFGSEAPRAGEGRRCEGRLAGCLVSAARRRRPARRSPPPACPGA